MKALELEEKEAKKMRGRGEVKIIQRVPLPRGNEDKYIRNKWSYKARRDLKQARRCEQMVYRVRCMFEPDEEQQEGHGVARPRARTNVWVSLRAAPVRNPGSKDPGGYRGYLWQIER